MTILIQGAYVLDLDRPFEKTDILIEDDLIVEVGASLAPRTGATTIDASDMIVMPGLINAHTHSNQAIEKGLADKLPLDAWMILASYGGAGARLEPRDLYVSAMVGAIEMLSTGTTAVLDCMRSDFAWLDTGMDAVMQAYADIGLRANLAMQYADLDFFSSIPIGLIDAPSDLRNEQRRSTVEEVLAQAEHFVDRWQGKHHLLTPMLGPSSVARCSDELFRGTVDLVKRKKVSLQSHLLSAKSQVAVGQERFSGSTVRHLAEIGALESWSSYAHGIWISDDEIPILASTNAAIVHNPVSNQKLGAGIAPVPDLDQAGVRIALGADGSSSGDSQNMFEVIKSTALIHRIANPPSKWLGASDALRMCWRGGASVMGHPIGRIARGYKADLTILKTETLFPAPKHQIVSQLVYAEMGRSVDTVFVGGELVLEHGKLTKIDAPAIIDEAKALATRIWNGLPERLTRFENIRPVLEELEAAVGRIPLAFARHCG